MSLYTAGMRVNNEADFEELLYGARLLAVAAAWSVLDLWRALAERAVPTDLSDLPGDLRALEITARVLAHGGLLEGSGRTFMLTDVGRRVYEQGGLPTGRHLLGLEGLGDLSQMAAVIRDGGPVRAPDGTPKATSGGVTPDDMDNARGFLDMLYHRSAGPSEHVYQWLSRCMPQAGRLLDLGGGHGRFARTFADRGYPVTLFDLPPVIGLARERHGELLEYRAGSYLEDDLGGPYDAALLSNIIHSESPADNARLFQRVFATLAPGGHMALRDVIVDDLGAGPPRAVSFGITMLFYTEQGRTYTMADIGEWAVSAGFLAPEAINSVEHALVLIRKPEA